jgi:membrane protein YdbS with pleckstrin-like domain
MGTTVECTNCGSPLQVPKPPPKPLMAELLEEPAPSNPASAAPGPEGDLLVLRPVRRAYLGTMAAIVVFALGTLSLLLWAWQRDFSALWSLIPLGLTLYAAWRVFYATRSITYRLTSERLFIQQGLIGRKQEEIELFRITDVSMEQTPLERMLRIGSILVNSTDESMPVARIENVTDPEKHKDTIRQAYRAARSREGMRAGEFIGSGL